jgi:hypothetical protein
VIRLPGGFGSVFLVAQMGRSSQSRDCKGAVITERNHGWPPSPLSRSIGCGCHNRSFTVAALTRAPLYNPFLTRNAIRSTTRME